VKFLLDTNIISEIRKGDRSHPNVARWVARTPVDEIGTSVIVLAEIRRGIALKRRRDPHKPNLSIDGFQRNGDVNSVHCHRNSLPPRRGRSDSK